VGVSPAFVVAVTAAYLTGEALTAYVDARLGAERRPVSRAPHPEEARP
jgi:hypothetical protein